MEFLNEMLMLNELGTVATIWEVLFAVVVSFMLGLLISFTYMKTYEGIGYSQGFVHTLVVMCVVISVIIVVIGSNIARAFSLAGALSIIRFRSAIRDPRDVAFIFFAMGAGLACGTGLYIPALLFAVILCILIYLITLLNFGGDRDPHRILKITIPENLNYEGLFDDIFNEHVEKYKYVSVKTTNLGTMFELTYMIKGKKGTEDKKLIDQIRSRNGNLNVSILMAPTEPGV